MTGAVLERPVQLQCAADVSRMCSWSLGDIKEPVLRESNWSMIYGGGELSGCIWDAGSRAAPDMPNTRPVPKQFLYGKCGIPC
jgi:hypothetical protein